MSSSTTTVVSPIRKTVFIQRVLKFSCTQSLRVVELTQVHPTWEETIKDYSTAAIIWKNTFLNAQGDAGRVDKEPEPAGPNVLMMAALPNPEERMVLEDVEVKKGMDRNLLIVFYMAIAKQVTWVIRQLLEIRIKQNPVPFGSQKHALNKHYLPVHVATANNAIESLKVLMEFSKSSNAPTLVNLEAYTTTEIADQYTALHTAIIDGAKVETIKFLIETAKLDINAKSVPYQYGPRYGITPLFLHVRDLTVPDDVLRYLFTVKGIKIDCENHKEDLFTPLQFCVRQGKFEVAEALLKEGHANPNYQSVNGVQRTCLHLCAASEKNPDYPMTKLLLQYGADPNLKESHGFTPLHVAVTHGKRDFIKILLEAKTKYGGKHDADPSIKDESRQTARDFAVARIKQPNDQYDIIAKDIAASADSPDDKKKLSNETKSHKKEGDGCHVQ